jgi:hypothetical protein
MPDRDELPPEPLSPASDAARAELGYDPGASRARGTGERLIDAFPAAGVGSSAGAVVAGADAGIRVASGPGVAARARKGVDRWALPLFTAAALTYLMIPIAVMILFSFNKPEGKFNFVWAEFSLDAWMSPLNRPGLSDALATSIVVALIATIAATALGTWSGTSSAAGRAPTSRSSSRWRRRRSCSVRRSSRCSWRRRRRSRSRASSRRACSTHWG